jgi:transposase
MPKSQPSYTAEFRAQAVALVRTGGKSVAAIARDLGVSDASLHAWVHQADIEAGRGRPGELTTAEREESRRLRRAVKVLQQEREIFKKAAPFFARETL